VNFVEFKNGVAINGQFPDIDVVTKIEDVLSGTQLLLTVADPPYGNIVNKDWDKIIGTDEEFTKEMIEWTKVVQKLSLPRSALYVWGGIGVPGFRPFYRYLIDVEHKTGYKVANHITWKKKRAYGIQHNFLFTREELVHLHFGSLTREEILYLHMGDNIKAPLVFNIPLLKEKRGYAGYNPDYPAKSEFFRRTNVWTDITEILKDKMHVAQKPVECMKIPIEVHTNAGDWVLDPFAGSGTTAVAAIEAGRKFIVVERDNVEFEKLVDRLKKVES
jgi:DNA modification methylase